MFCVSKSSKASIPHAQSSWLFDFQCTQVHMYFWGLSLTSRSGTEAKSPNYLTAIILKSEIRPTLWKCSDKSPQIPSGKSDHSLIAAYKSRHGEKYFPSYVFKIKTCQITVFNILYGEMKSKASFYYSTLLHTAIWRVFFFLLPSITDYCRLTL